MILLVFRDTVYNAHSSQYAASGSSSSSSSKILIQVQRQNRWLIQVICVRAAACCSLRGDAAAVAGKHNNAD